jgi:hypothetical protein
MLKSQLKVLRSEEKFTVVVDHTLSILNSARDYREKENYDYANIFYALYFEHETNGFIQRLLIRRKISKKSSKRIMGLALTDKLTWVVELLGVQPPNPEFIKFIDSTSSQGSLLNERNGFIHYKWDAADIEEDSGDSIVYDHVEKQISYFRSYRSRIIYGGKKAIAHKRISDIVNHRV